LQKGVLCVALDVLGYNPETGGGVNWRIRGGIDQATAEDDRQIVRENQSSSPRTKRDVKNEDRSDYVYENTCTEDKMSGDGASFLQENASI
jgi:hypothetical protein